MTIRINTQISSFAYRHFPSRRGSSTKQTSIKTLKIKWKFNASVLPFIRREVNRQRGSELGNG